MATREATKEWKAATLPVLGVETTFVTHSAAVAGIIEREYGHWRTLADIPDIIRPSKAVVEVSLRRAAMALPECLDFDFSLPEPSRMEVACAVARGVADSRALRSVAHVDSCLLERPEELARGILEPLTLFLLGVQDRVPLHAAAVLRRDVGIVLAGPSGTGKSTLVYAATRAGYTPVADDPVYIQVEPTLRVWGRHGRLHLRPDAPEHFPELADVQPTLLPGGKTKLIVDGAIGRRYAERVGLCILRRGWRQMGLTRISVQEAQAALTERLDPGFDLFEATIGDRVARVAERGAWMLDLGDSPRAALPLLDEVADAIEGWG